MKNVVSVKSGLAVLAVLALATLAVGTSVVAGATSTGPAGASDNGQAHRCDPSAAIHAALGHRMPGETLGSVISEIAQQCRPLIRH